VFVYAITWCVVLGFGILYFFDKIEKEGSKKLPEKGKIEAEQKITVHTDIDDIQKDGIYKQLKVINRGNEKIRLSCAFIEQIDIFYDKNEHKPIELKSNDILWAKSTLNVIDNKTDLVCNIPKRLYFLRIDKKRKKAEIIGIEKYSTPINKGRYLVQMRLDADNISSRTGYIIFSYDGKKSINFETKNINLSIACPLVGSLGINPIRFDPEKISVKCHWSLLLWLKKKQLKS
jgi:hypothetical protein